MARSGFVLFGWRGSLSNAAFLLMWLAPSFCFSDSLTRSRNMLLSLRGSLTGLADPLIRLAPPWVLFPLRGSIFETALHWVWLTRDLCFSVILARSGCVLVYSLGSLSFCALQTKWLNSVSMLFAHPELNKSRCGSVNPVFAGRTQPVVYALRLKQTRTVKAGSGGHHRFRVQGPQWPSLSCLLPSLPLMGFFFSKGSKVQ